MDGYGVNVKVGGHYVDLHAGLDRHTAKKFAGSIFHADPVQSVCVYNDRGAVALYLKKTADGVVREENLYLN